MEILHITSILPSPLKSRENENDILIRLAIEYEKKFPEDHHHFWYILPYSNRIFSVLKPKWKEYYQLIQSGGYYLGDYRIHVFGFPTFKQDLKIRSLLTYLGYLLNRKRIEQLLINDRPDVIHSHNMMNNMELGEILRRKLNCRLIQSLRNVNPYSLSRLKTGAVKADFILSINYIAKEVCSRFLEKEAVMIPHPVDDRLFVDIDSIQKVAIPVKLVSVCKLIKLKNIDKVLQALARNKQEFVYTIIGEGPERAYLTGLALDLGISEQVKFLGQLPYSALADELKCYDLFIMPSYPETLGRAFFEAMASGLPVVGAKKAGVDGIIKHGVHGFLVDPNNIEEIADAIFNFTQMPIELQSDMKRSAALLAQQFTWNTTLEKYYQLYHGEYSLPE